MTLDPQQQAAATCPAATVLVSASPGSGKTRTLIERVQFMLTEVGPSAIICVTFTNTAADEINKRLGGVKLSYVGTIHGLMLGIIQKYGYLIGFKKHGVGVMDEAQTENMIKDIISDLKLKCTPPQLVAALPNAFAQLKATAAMRHLKPATIGAMAYYDTVRSQNLLDFDSLLTFGLWAMQAAIKSKVWREPYSALLVDEFQDANKIDAEIYSTLPVTWRFMVGDSDQSIFAFRGADVTVMLEMSRDPRTTLLKLESNYRSDVAICHLADKLIQHNKNRIDKRLFPVSDKLGDVQFSIGYDSPSDEASHIADDIKQYQHIYSPDDCAVLLRTNNLVQFFSEELERRGLKVKKKEWQQKPPDWAKCRMFINLLVNPENDMLAHWWLKETRGSHEANKIKLQSLGALKSINRYLLKIPTGIPINEAAGLLARAGIGQESLDRVETALKLLGPTDGLSELSLRLGQELHRGEAEAGGVTVSTCHASKGTEHQVVYIPCLNEGVWPPGKADDVAEERRLLFVAVTRAENKLVLSHSKTAFDWNRKLRPAAVSMFWEELQ